MARGKNYFTAVTHFGYEKNDLIPDSASSPTAASVISLVNDALLAADKPVLGFLNPWLYAGGYKAFTDITAGSAVGCDTSGFPAKEGWDAVTGFGTPVSTLLHTTLFPRMRSDSDYSSSQNSKLQRWITASSGKTHFCIGNFKPQI